jgi:hypothetical protein
MNLFSRRRLFVIFRAERCGKCLPPMAAEFSSDLKALIKA